MTDPQIEQIADAIRAAGFLIMIGLMMGGCCAGRK